MNGFVDQENPKALPLYGDAKIMKRYPSSGISILVIGGGIAGLAFAIEAHRKGHDIRIIEKRAHFEDFG